MMSEDFENHGLFSLPRSLPLSAMFPGGNPCAHRSPTPTSSCGAAEPALSLSDSRRGGKPSSQQPGAVTRTPSLNIDSQACNLPPLSTVRCLSLEQGDSHGRANSQVGRPWHLPRPYPGGEAKATSDRQGSLCSWVQLPGPEGLSPAFTCSHQISWEAQLVVLGISALPSTSSIFPLHCS